MAWWRFVVNALLPPPLILLVLLILPSPRQLRQGFLLFTEKFMCFRVVGGIKLIHFMITVTGIAFAGSIDQTMRLTKLISNQAMDENATPNQRAGFLAKKWREERNFWIAFMTFMLWCILYRFFQISTKLIRLEDQLGPPPAVSPGFSLRGVKDKLTKGKAAPMGDPDPAAPTAGEVEVEKFPAANPRRTGKKVA